MKNDNSTKSEKKEDFSGKDRVVKNVIASWASHFILIIIGFIMPRMINDNLGQVSLGVWDLSWSFVNYLTLTGMGVGSSVNRYVAKYRAMDDLVSLNRSLSSVVFIQFVISFLVVVGTGSLVLLMPKLIQGHEGVELHQVSWVIGLLGLSLAVQMAFDTSRGLLTGMHRWDLYNSLNAFAHIINAVFMVIAMLLGFDLIALAAIYFVVTFTTELTRSIIATRMCKGLSLSKDLVNLHDSKKMFLYGVKSIMSSAPTLVVTQTMSIIIASALGPAALAIFSRPMALVRHMETFLNKFSFVLTPMVGSIQAAGDKEELKVFLKESTKYSVSFTLPIVLFLAILGDHLLQIWMGNEYASLTLISILAVGHLLPISQGPSLRVLMGLNQHGRIAVANLFITLVLLTVGLIAVYSIGWELKYIAILTGSILTIIYGVILPIYTCRVIKIKVSEYVIWSFLKPTLIGFVQVGWLMFCRQLEGFTSLQVLGIGAIGDFFILAILYWLFLLPSEIKTSLISKIRS
jgi:O-antigen/teichoic acid export membrane protein